MRGRVCGLYAIGGCALTHEALLKNEPVSNVGKHEHTQSPGDDPAGGF